MATTTGKTQRRIRSGFGLAGMALLLGACGPLSTSNKPVTTASAPAQVSPASAVSTSARERECLIRAMYFESHRSSEDGLLAVGTVVMNRVDSPKYPDTICGVVGQKRQFAAGVLRRKMNPRDLPKVEQAADAVLAGKRHGKVGRAMFFHQAGLRFSYKNMHYVAVAGGNAFYERRSRSETQVASAETRPVVPEVKPASAPDKPLQDVEVAPVIPAAAPKVPQRIEDLIEPAGVVY